MRAHVRLALLLMFITIGSGLAGTGTAQVLSDEQLAQSIKMREDAIKQKNAMVVEKEKWIKEREKAIADAQRAQAKYRKTCEDPEQVVIRLLLESGLGDRYAVTARSKADLWDDLYLFALFDHLGPQEKKKADDDDLNLIMGAWQRAQALFKAVERRSNEYKRTLLVEVNRLAQVIENGRSRVKEAKDQIGRLKLEIAQLTKDIATLRKQMKEKGLDVAYALEGEWNWFSGGILLFTKGEGQYSDPRDPKKKGACTASANPDVGGEYKGYAIKLTWTDHWVKGHENYYRDYLNVGGWGEPRSDGSHGRATSLEGINNDKVRVSGRRLVPPLPKR